MTFTVELNEFKLGVDAPIRGAASRCAALSHARESQCAEAISRFAEAILEQGETPPSVCTQPGRGR